jgi:deoxycytidine triphosphate deaminase
MSMAKILTDKDIRSLADEGHYITSPLVYQNVMPSSIDLRIGTEKNIFSGETILLGDEEGEEQWKKEAFTQLEITRGEASIVSIMEKINMPKDCMGLILPRGSVTRNLITIPSVYINPGYSGSPSLTLINNSNVSVNIIPATRIAQLIIFKLGSTPRRDYTDIADSKYSDEDASTPQMRRDREIDEILQKIMNHEFPTTFERIISDK